MLLLKQSTAVSVLIGPFLDDSDGNTVEDSLTISQADVRLSKNAGNMAQKNESTSCTHDELGYYTCPLDATDTGTLGRLKLMVHESGALPVWHEFMVVPANTWDSLVGGTDYLDANAVQIEGSDATDQINAACDTALSDYDGPTDAEMDAAFAALNDLSAAEVNAEVDTALADYDPPTKAELDSGLAGLNDPSAADIRAEIDSNSTQLAAIVADTNELQTDDIPTLIAALPTAAENRAEMDSNSTQLAAIVADTNELQTDDVPGLIAALNDVSTAEVNAEVDTALADIHLDHLLAADYDPASKPGTATALLNELVENDGGVSRFTANSLEQAPSGGTNPNVLADTTAASVTSQTEFTLTAGSSDDDAYNDQAIVIYDASNSDYPSIRKVTDYTGSTKTVTIDSGPDFTMVTGDGVKIFVTAPGTTAPTAAAIRAEIDSNSTQLAAIVADTDELQTDDVPGLIAALENVSSSDVQTAAAAALTAYDPPTKSELDSGLAGLNDPTAAAIADAVWDEAAAGHTDAGKAGEQLWTDVDAILADTNELQTDDVPTLIAALPTAAENRTEMDSNSTQLAAIVADTNELQTDDVPGLIAALNDPTAAEIRSEIDSNSSQLAAIVADTNELQTDDVPGLIAALNDVSTAEVNAEVDTALADYDPPTKAELDSGLAGLNDPTAAAIRTEIDSNSTQLAAILTDTAEIGAAGAGLTAVPWNSAWDAEVESEALDALNTALADSVPSDGSLPTARQALYMIAQFLTERAVSGTTVTVKKVDGSTTLMTFTLDDGTTPTSITRSG